jgi:hypothetical protein
MREIVWTRGGDRQTRRPAGWHRKDLPESLAIVSLEGAVGDEVELFEPVECAKDFVLIKGKRLADAVSAVPANSLPIGDEAQKGVDGEVVGRQSGKPSIAKNAGVDPAKPPRMFDGTYAIELGDDDAWRRFFSSHFEPPFFLVDPVAFF